MQLSHKLQLRLTPEDYEKLVELRLVLRLGTDSETVRALIRMHSAVERAAVKRLRRDERARTLLRNATDPRRRPS